VPDQGAHRGIQLKAQRKDPLGLFCPPLVELFELLRLPGDVLARLLPRLRFARCPALVGMPHGIFTLFRSLTGRVVLLAVCPSPVVDRSAGWPTASLPCAGAFVPA